MDSKYSPLRGSDTMTSLKGKTYQFLFTFSIVINIILVLFNFTVFGEKTLVEQALPSAEIPPGYAKVDSIPTIWKQFWWDTPYGSMNHSESDPLWEAILPSHGFVAMDREWAAQQQWPVSMYLPSDKTKGVYLLEAYHQLHCLRILRKTFWEAVDGREYTYEPGHHVNHCFDTLRQTVQCNADNTPLYTFGDKTAGDGQLHQCRDWNQLRDFATKHTACYRDSVQDILLGEHFGFCDDGNDGIEA